MSDSSNFAVKRAHVSRICSINTVHDYAYSVFADEGLSAFFFLLKCISELPLLKFHMKNNVLHVLYKQIKFPR